MAATMKSIKASKAYEHFAAAAHGTHKFFVIHRNKMQEVKQMKDNLDGTFTMYWYVGTKGLGKITLRADALMNYSD